MAVPKLAGKGGSGARTSPARSSSRGPEECFGGVPAPMALLAPEVPVPDAVAEVAKAQEPPVSRDVATLLPPPLAPLVPCPSAFSDVLERALSGMVQLQEDLQGAEPRL